MSYHLDELDELNPDFIEGLKKFLVFGSQSDNYFFGSEHALNFINSGLVVEPDSISGWAYKATLLHNLEKYDEAVKSWKQAIKLTRLTYPETDDYFLILMLISSLDSCKKFDESYAISEKILENCVNDDWTISFLTSISTTALHLKKYDVVIKSSRLAIGMLTQKGDEYDVAFEDTWLELCHALYFSHKFDEVEIVVNSYLQKFPNNVLFLTRMGQILIEQKKYQKAIQFFERSLVINSKNDKVWFGMAKAYSGLNNIQRVLDCLLITFSLNSTYKQNILEDKIFSELKDNPEFQRIFNLSY